MILTDEMVGLGEKAPCLSELPISAWAYWDEVGPEILAWKNTPETKAGGCWEVLVWVKSREDAEKLIRTHNSWLSKLGSSD